jgi:hypothetical protein
MAVVRRRGPGAGELGGPGLPGRTRIGSATLTSNAVMEQDSFGHFIREAERSADALMEDIVGTMEDRARRNAPVRTGHLRRNIHGVVLRSGREGRVTTDVPYAGPMEHGSRPHLIHGVRANFNWKGGRFVWNDHRYGPIGETFVATGIQPGGVEARRRNRTNRGKSGYQNWTYTYGATVRHPGTKPHFFFKKAFMQTWPEVRIMMRKAYG